MPCTYISCVAEHHMGRESTGTLIQAKLPEEGEALLSRFGGQVQTIYLDPPFNTGKQFDMKARIGEKGYRTGSPSLSLPAYDDRWPDRAEYLSMMKQTLLLSRELLKKEGTLFLHIDSRMYAHLRLLMDEVFGESNFLNEIIWVYQSGGRSLKYFSRKHDVILFYRKSPKYDFNVEEVMVAPSEPRSNHMRRHVDPDGRVYRSIRSNGRVYTYYDDDPVAPSDVWNDLSHLQQRDPERTGYDTQKPLALLDRIVKCGSREGELVADLFAGSGTTLEAARLNGRRFLGVDRCPMTLNIARRRLCGSSYALEFEPFEGAPVCEASMTMGVGFYHVTLEKFALEPGLLGREFEGLDAVDAWSVGYLKPEGFCCMAESLRTRREPRLKTELDAPVYAGELAVCVCDVAGRCFYYRIDGE